MRTCQCCGQDKRILKSGIIRGEFGEYCNHCIMASKRSISTGYAQWSRDRDREDNARDLLQPRDYNGKPNREFIKEYPEQSKEMFTREELERYE